MSYLHTTIDIGCNMHAMRAVCKHTAIRDIGSPPFFLTVLNKHVVDTGPPKLLIPPLHGFKYWETLGSG